MNVVVTGGAGFIGSHLVDRSRDYGRVIPLWLDMARAGEPRVVYGGHRQEARFLGDPLTRSVRHGPMA